MDIFKEGNSMIDIYFITNDVDGLRPGAASINSEVPSLKNLRKF